MILKILVAGTLLLLSSACLLHLGALSEKNDSRILMARDKPSSLFTRSELEEFFSQKMGSSQTVVSSLSPTLFTPVQSIGKPEVPISDESNDDFSWGSLPGDQQKKKPNFDIPIVINEKVEQFIQYFQTTAKDRFVTWLARSGRYIPVMKKLLKATAL